MKLPKTPKGILSRIKEYEDYLKYEKRTFGEYHDGRGVRYVIGPLYMLMGDFDGALKSYKLFEKRFPDDIGDPFQYLMWSLALYKNEKYLEAESKLIETMLMNLYLVPYVYGEDIKMLNIDHSSNYEEKEFLKYLPVEYLNLWDDKSKEWAKSIYYWNETIQIREKYIKLEKLLINEPVGTRRSELVKEISNLKESVKSIRQHSYH